jgi:CheY-like chemotaxis protein
MTTLLDEDLLTPADAAQVLGLSGDMVRLLARSGRLPTAARSVRGARMFRRGEVEQLAAERAGRLICNHGVQFYESLAYLSEVVSRFILETLAQDARAIVIATPGHRASIQQALEEQGQDVPKLQADAQLMLLDARQTLSEVMVDGTVDPVHFRQTAGALVQRYASAPTKPRLHVYSEMVDLLWKDGVSLAAFQLEELWNGLAREQPFNLMCGYAMSHFGEHGQADAFVRVCASHSRVAPTEQYQRHNTRDARLREIAMLQRQSVALDQEVAHRERLERELAFAKELLEESERARESILDRLNHELRNPLAPIVTALELSARKRDPARQNAIITRQVKQLVKALDDVLEDSPSPALERAILEVPPEATAPTARASTPRRQLPSRCKIMIVDDNVDAAESLCEVLEELGYASRIAHDATSALELARIFEPELALIDIGLPGMNGIDLARQLKGRGDTSAMRLIALTGYSRNADREQTRAAGCEAHLVKPVDLHALETTLARLLPGGMPHA